ncbi:uncharacterized protein LOC113226339 [Hyposmocoma kahamanoa]|uniref:uncharacterized protein LOC113226339 n=1 Tax=Hyposmocoma kahamanoa TaxID=1477025 RepID=UPI000E6D6030|nr:uncharacterized protein LOC113226339 [Hyposmocoma kahamanoa]
MTTQTTAAAMLLARRIADYITAQKNRVRGRGREWGGGSLYDLGLGRAAAKEIGQKSLAGRTMRRSDDKWSTSTIIMVTKKWIQKCGMSCSERQTTSSKSRDCAWAAAPACAPGAPWAARTAASCPSSAGEAPARPVRDRGVVGAPSPLGRRERSRTGSRAGAGAGRPRPPLRTDARPELLVAVLSFPEVANSSFARRQRDACVRRLSSANPDALATARTASTRHDSARPKTQNIFFSEEIFEGRKGALGSDTFGRARSANLRRNMTKSTVRL